MNLATWSREFLHDVALCWTGSGQLVLYLLWLYMSLLVENNIIELGLLLLMIMEMRRMIGMMSAA